MRTRETINVAISNMPILDFPSRFALLVRSWRINHTSQAIIDTLGIKKDVLSKYVSGDTKNLSNRSSFGNLTKLFALFLEKAGYLKNRNLTQDEFVRRFSDPDDLNFIQFASQQHELPLPKSVRSARRTEIESLANQLTGNFLLYRLGIDKIRRQDEKNRNVTLESKLPVLRRIPFQIDDIGTNYLIYRDAYDWYKADPQQASASGYVFYATNHICVFAEDVNDRRQSDLFMMQIQDRLLDSSDKDNPLRDGVIVMNSDGNQPTGSKVIVRKVSEEFQSMPWDEFSKRAQAKIALHDDDVDGQFKLIDPNEDVEMIGTAPIGSKPYSWYADRLQIRNYKLHISFGDGAL